MRLGRVVVVGLAGWLGVSGCAVPIEGEPRAGAVVSSAPEVDPDSREARWMDDYCAFGQYFQELELPEPRTTSDPAELKRQISESTGRMVEVLDNGLAKLRKLMPAPAGGVDDVINDLIEHLSTARGSIATAKSTVDNVAELTAETAQAALDSFTRGVTSLQEAVKLLDIIDLPDELKDAAEVAPNCR
ncbi:MAG TPA: hypothetical protein VFV67_33185 [Actinophytocola sp.]|uniref:hypothetical protein n=1 Tax=Actinophytocola sp. TaxID=1872138 RepID=UPI002DBED41B|nr:hypothetical protein [Actinophytocola sp.]HEU5475523.1 hypothetical protein [Actinophytocola sp.]